MYSFGKIFTCVLRSDFYNITVLQYYSFRKAKKIWIYSLFTA